VTWSRDRERAAFTKHLALPGAGRIVTELGKKLGAVLRDHHYAVKPLLTVIVSSRDYQQCAWCSPRSFSFNRRRRQR
jgi:hypothetical protein